MDIRKRAENHSMQFNTNRYFQYYAVFHTTKSKKDFQKHFRSEEMFYLALKMLIANLILICSLYLDTMTMKAWNGRSISFALYIFRLYTFTWTFVFLPGFCKCLIRLLYKHSAKQHSQQIAKIGKIILVKIRYKLVIFYFLLMRNHRWFFSLMIIFKKPIK